MDFHVQNNGEEVDNDGTMVPMRRWVFGVNTDSKEFLITDNDKGFCWVPISQCKLTGTTAGCPQPVVVIPQGVPKPDLAIVRGAGLPKNGGQRHG